MTKPRAFLHIGAPKCASSLIQGILNEPDIGGLISQKYVPHICQCIQSVTPAKDMTDFHYIQIVDQIKSIMPKKDIVLSLENLFGMMTHSENCYKVSCQFIDRMWEGFDIKVFMYVRRQDTFLESMYNQDVKRGETRSFEDYVGGANMDNLHWDSVADAYSRFDLTVRPFERKVLQTGGYVDFIDALFQWLGVEVDVEYLPVVNPSLSPGGLKVQKLANEVLTEKQAYDLSMWLERHAAKKPDERHDFFGDKREQILNNYRDSNRRLFERFMPQFDSGYYMGK